MKILFITDFLDPFVNGISTYSENTIRCLKKAGHNVTTFGPKGSPTADYHLPTLDLYRYPSIETNLCFPNWKLLKTVMKDDYDIIHINCPQGLSGWWICMLSKFKKFKVVYFNHGNISAWFRFNVKSPLARMIFTKFFVAFYYLPQRLFSPLIVQNPGSEDLSLHFKKKLPVVEGACGVNLEVFKFSPSYEKYHLVAIGRLSKEKNWQRLITLFAELPPHYQLTIIGTGHQKKLKKHCRKLGLHNVTFIGKISHAELCSYLQKGQACITASLFETWGLTLMEGLACGVPPIYPNHHPFTDLYTSSFPNGCYDIDDPKTFVKAVIQTENTTSEGRKKCYHFAQQFSWEHATEKLIESYKLAMKTASGK
jgi:glycosyltransferase involved in cell wall biosynthesis